MQAISIENLSVSLGGRKVLNKISAAIPSGKIIGLLGPSGAGKTTLIRTILGLQTFKEGEVLVLGEPPSQKTLRTKIGYISQGMSVYTDLTVNENIKYFAWLINTKEDIQGLLDAVELKNHGKRVTRTLSGGEKARVALAIAMLGSPELLILDEPTVGLDPVLRQKMWDKFTDLATSGKTVVISSHVMDEAEKCDEILFVREGSLLITGSRSDILKKTGTDSMENAFLKLAQGAGK